MTGQKLKIGEKDWLRPEEEMMVSHPRPKPTPADILGAISKAESGDWMDPVDRLSSGGRDAEGVDFVTSGVTSVGSRFHGNPRRIGISSTASDDS
jgi:hypothetical protein